MKKKRTAEQAKILKLAKVAALRMAPTTKLPR